MPSRATKPTNKPPRAAGQRRAKPSARAGAARSRVAAAAAPAPAPPPKRLPREADAPRTPRAKPLGVVRLRVPGAPPAAYEVCIGSGLIPTAAHGLISPGGAALVVVDANLSKDLTVPLLKALDTAGVRWGVSVLGASESEKSLASLERVLAEAGRIRLGRDGLVIALGGGIVGDVAGFAAAVFARGVRVVQCPTTLLAMVDASVGGKTGVNLLVPAGAPGESDASKPRLVKNLVGAFHQPSRVVCDLDCLRTLASRDLRAGLAECLKHALLGGEAGEPGLLEWTERHLEAILAREPGTLAQLVQRNVAIKARVVANDPREDAATPPAKGGLRSGPARRLVKAGRLMLNLGHTFAHVLEPLNGLSWASPPESGTGLSRVAGPLRHGEAVGLGLIAACRVAEHLRLCETGLSGRIESMLARVGLPRRVAGLPESGMLFERMRDDKKVSGGRVRLVLPRRGRRVVIEPNADAEVVCRAFDGLREQA